MGRGDGTLVGANEGLDVGKLVGVRLGTGNGTAVGCIDGKNVGSDVGT